MRAAGPGCVRHVMRKGHGAGPRAVPCAGRAAASLQCEEGPGRLDGHAAARTSGPGRAGPGCGAERGGAEPSRFFPCTSPGGFAFLMVSVPKSRTKILERCRRVWEEKECLHAYIIQLLGAFPYMNIFPLVFPCIALLLYLCLTKHLLSA